METSQRRPIDIDQQLAATEMSMSMSMSNVNLYSAFSQKTSNALNTLVLRK